MTSGVSLVACYLQSIPNIVKSLSWLVNLVRPPITTTLNDALLTTKHTVYAIITELPAVYILYDSPFWSGAFLWVIFAVSVWNGGGFYIEVFGRK